MYRSVASLRAQPGYQVEIASACEDATPKDELGGVNHHAEDVEARLEDCQGQLHHDIGQKVLSGYSQTDMRENTSPAASIPTKMNEMPRTVR
jgi:hypothetical protein